LAAVDFYYGIGSRYSYLAATQLDRLVADSGCTIRWRPLWSGDLFRARGADPFAGPPVSGQYAWSYRRFDAECWADYYGVPFREPENVDFDPRRLALACTAAADLGAVEAFSRRLFGALFAEGRSPLDDRACARIAVEIGLDGAAFLRRLRDPATTRRLDATVEEALAYGVFGVPSFVLAGRVYWGNDRLPLVRHALRRLGNADVGPAQTPDQRRRGRTQVGRTP
jgi:2-hydroxychromene-2-carboxylate isomerase